MENGYFKKSFSQITNGNHSLTNWDYNSKSNLHVFGINTIENPGDLYLRGKTQKKITSHYDYIKMEFNLPTQKVVSWNGEDGVRVEGILYLPHNFQESKKYPLVVQTHGGPRSSDKYGFSRGSTRYNAVLTGKVMLSYNQIIEVALVMVTLFLGIWLVVILINHT